MTTLHPTKRARFYIAMGTNDQRFQKGKEPVIFTLPAGTKFPTDLSVIMKKTGRFFSINDGVEAVSLPQCEGDGCECVSCQPSGCMTDKCIDFTTSIDNIQCNNPSCVRSNDVKYYMTPLYPDTSTYLPEYNPKFRFIKFIPSQKIQRSVMEDIENKYIKKQENEYDDKKFKIPFPPGWTLEPDMTFPPGDFIPLMETMPPGETIPPGWKIVSNMLIPDGNTFPPELQFGPPTETDNHQVNTQNTLPPEIETPELVVFSITYPDISDFNTSEKFIQLYNSIFRFILGFLILNETKYVQHNIAVLQQIIKINNLPKTLFNPKKISITQPSTTTDIQIIEKYDDIDLQNLVVPSSSYEDTDVSTELMTPEPDETTTTSGPNTTITSGPNTTTTSGPNTTTTMAPRPKGLSTMAKVGIGIAVGFFVIVVIGGVFYTKSKKQGKKKGK